MRGEKTFLLLELLAETARASGGFFDAFLTDYHTSYRMLRGMRGGRQKNFSPPPKPTRHQFYNLLSSLKRDGLARSERSQWEITAKGKRIWRVLRRKLAAALPEPLYPVTPVTQQWSIVTFDIPETAKKKREWLRFALKRFGFTMLHKSVWIGKVALPVDFLNDLESIGLLPYIHILAVTKTGSLKHINSFSATV